METIKISLPDMMFQWVGQQVQSGEYTNVNDYIYDLIRHDQQRNTLLQLALIEGENSGESNRSVGDIIVQTKFK